MLVRVRVRVHMARRVQDISGERLGGVVVSQYGTGGYWKRRGQNTNGRSLMAATTCLYRMEVNNAVSHDGPSTCDYGSMIDWQEGKYQREWKRLRKESRRHICSARIELRHQRLASVSRVWNRSPTLIWRWTEDSPNILIGNSLS